MPTYKYFCPKCKVISNRITSIEQRDCQRCSTCFNILERRADTEAFSVKTPLDTSKKDPYTNSEIDKVVGGSADKKWNVINKKKAEKLSGKNVVDIGVKSGETFNPEHFLGDATRKEKAKLFSDEVKKSKDLKKPETDESWKNLGFKKIEI